MRRHGQFPAGETLFPLEILSYAFFNFRAIHTRITAPTKATRMDPMIPPPGQMPSTPNSQPPTMPPSIPRMMSTSTPYPLPFITFPAGQPAGDQPNNNPVNHVVAPSSFSLQIAAPAARPF